MSEQSLITWDNKQLGDQLCVWQADGAPPDLTLHSTPDEKDFRKPLGYALTYTSANHAPVVIGLTLSQGKWVSRWLREAIALYKIPMEAINEQ